MFRPDERIKGDSFAGRAIAFQLWKSGDVSVCLFFAFLCGFDGSIF